MPSRDGDFLISFARDAGAVLRASFGKSFAYTSKAPGEFVTDAEMEVEKLIISAISRKYPGDAIFSEESGGSENVQRRWIIDPLDGTTNFIFGVPHIAVSIALEERGSITKGVVFNPVSDELYFSEEGVSLLNDRPVKCSNRARLAECLVTPPRPSSCKTPAAASAITTSRRGTIARRASRRPTAFCTHNFGKLGTGTNFLPVPAHRQNDITIFLEMTYALPLLCDN
jgi:fructose-1,6-bisphosphatase/inositol monophosphatase family enzyme